MDWAWAKQWALESPYLSFILILVVLNTVKTILIRIFGKRPVVKQVQVSVEEALAYIRSERPSMTEDEVRRVLTQQVIENRVSRAQEPTDRASQPRRSVWDRLRD